MDKSQQMQIIKRVWELKKELSKYTNDGKKFGSEGQEVLLPDLVGARMFLDRAEPKAPVKVVIKRTYPPIVLHMKFNWILALAPLIAAFVITLAFGVSGAILGALLFPLSIVWIPIYYFAIHRKKKKEETERIKNSAEYKNQCAAADKVFDKQQAEADAKYQAEKKVYDEVTLPEYKKRYAESKAAMDAYYEKNRQHMSEVQAELDKLLSQTKIIPLPYQKVDALEYIYNVLATSCYDIKTAFEMYDRNEQRKIEEERLHAQQRAEQHAQEAAYYAEQQAYQQAQSQSSSDGGGFAKDLARGVVGGAVAGRVARGKKNDGSGRQNFFGSAGCAVAQGKSGICMNGVGCNLSLHCTQQGRYKVGG